MDIKRFLPQFIYKFLFEGHHRSIKAKRNIIASIFLKGLSISINLILVPLTINYINPAQYGIWITISSVVGWFSFFDIGLTQGLRNKFAEAKAHGDNNLAGIYISTTYAILGIICLSVWIIFSSIIPFLNWSKIVNSSNELNSEITSLAFIVFSYFCLQFVFKIVSTVITADQKPSLSTSIDLLGQIVALIAILLLKRLTQGTLVNLGLALCLSPLLILILANFIFFNTTYKSFKPKLSKVHFKHAKSLFNIGVIFLVIQIAGIIQYQTASIIIAQNFNSLEVTSYNIVFKYFGILTMAYNIFLTPFWSASTEAYIKNDLKWIKNSIRKYNYLNLIMVLVGILMLIFSSTIYDLWIGNKNVLISFNLSIWGCLFHLLLLYGSKYSFFLNGISTLRIQFISCIISPFIFFISAWILIKVYHVGAHAVFISSIIANINGIFLAPLQYYMIIYKNKKGIWIR